ncbi:hypothetical protein HNO89_002197 [Sporosarcina luteola]|nr:hypothetical protein [Sporosarcina luteola]
MESAIPNNSSELLELLKKSSDIILSGHEHTTIDTDTFDRVNRNYVSIYEGGLFQGIESPEISEFNVIQINIEDKEKKDLKYSWKENIFKKDFDSDWITLYTNEINMNLYFKKDFSEGIKEYSIPVTHPRVEFNINSLFIYPDVKEILLQDKNSELLKLENSFDVLESLKSQHHLHFFGDKESGKTSLAKKFHIELINCGKYPLLASGSQIKQRTHTDVEKFIRRTADQQYENSTEESIQLQREKRVLIVDDWELSEINEDTQIKTIKEFSRWFDNVILLSTSKFDNFKSIKLASINNQESTFNYRQFEIEKLGHFKRNELISKWISLGQELNLDPEEHIRKPDEYERTLNTIIGKDFVSSYPLMILVLLATLETNEPHKLANGSNGYYYEILIKQTLSKMQIKYDDTNKLYNYLTELAYEVYQFSNNQLITLKQWMTYHKNRQPIEAVFTE